MAYGVIPLEKFKTFMIVTSKGRDDGFCVDLSLADPFSSYAELKEIGAL